MDEMWLFEAFKLLHASLNINSDQSASGLCEWESDGYP